MAGKDRNYLPGKYIPYNLILKIDANVELVIKPKMMF